MPTPALRSFTLEDVRFLIDGKRSIQADSVLMASGQTSSLTPDHRHPPGTVLGEHTSDGKWYLAAGGSVVAPTQATITSSSHSDGNGAIKLVGTHGTISVTTTTGTGTEANHATDLNANQEFSASYIATSGAGELTIKSLRAGPDEWFYIHSDTLATVGFAEGVANEVRGTGSKYRVTTTWVDLKDLDGTAKDELVPVLSAGYFDESVLASLTNEARAELIRNGSAFG